MDTSREKIIITESTDKPNVVRPIDEKVLKVRYDLENWTAEALYNGKWYLVRGDIFCGFIVIN